MAEYVIIHEHILFSVVTHIDRFTNKDFVRKLTN